jgi:hypothetical protein
MWENTSARLSNCSSSRSGRAPLEPSFLWQLIGGGLGDGFRRDAGCVFDFFPVPYVSLACISKYRRALAYALIRRAALCGVMGG